MKPSEVVTGPLVTVLLLIWLLLLLAALEEDGRLGAVPEEAERVPVRGSPEDVGVDEVLLLAVTGEAGVLLDAREVVTPLPDVEGEYGGYGAGPTDGE
ncbi:hypothetical protein B0A54_04868 [Friedmanniomyces endolithicus]|uniref:Uncharacterized protein n=1 Tax=Friedmanniomyces endolithicus TaxID=329885 RepID=A0A4U0V6V4_9PEZI|nr:hypothetical protein B0A54_04868 [Friedmanniomyces endolithicus]